MYRIVTREYMAQGHDGFLLLKGRKYLVDDESGQMMSAIVRKYLLGASPLQAQVLSGSEADFRPHCPGCRFVNRLSRKGSMHRVKLLDPETSALVSREKARQSHAARHRSRSKSKDRKLPTGVRSLSPLGGGGGGSGRTTPTHRSLSPARALGDMWRRVAGLALRWSRAHYRDHLRITGREHMSDVDCFDGARVRKGRFEREAEKEPLEDEELDGADEDLAVIHPVVDGRLKDEGRK